MKHLAVTLLFSALLAAAPAFAASGSGNGGGGIVCRNPVNNQLITSVELYDLWEGRNAYGLTIPPSSEGSEMQLSQAIARLEKLHSFFAGDVRETLEGVKKRIAEDLASGPTNVYIPITNDSNHRLMPKFCPKAPEVRPNFEQIVNYTDEGTLFLDKELIGLLSAQEFAALELHEAIYKALRIRQDEPDSFNTRKIVAYAFSRATDEQLMGVLKESLREVYVPAELEKMLKTSLKMCAFDSDIAKAQAIIEARFTVYGEPVRLHPSGALFVDLLHFSQKSAAGVKIANLLLDAAEKGFDVNEFYNTPYYHAPPIIAAVETGSPALVRRLIHSFPELNVNQEGQFRETAFSLALGSMDIEMIRAVMESPSADINYSRYGSALAVVMTDLKEGSLEIAQLLLSDPRLDPNKRGGMFDSPLAATLNNGVEEKIVSAILLLFSNPRFNVFAGGQYSHVRRLAEASHMSRVVALLDAIALDPKQIKNADAMTPVFTKLECTAQVAGEVLEFSFAGNELNVVSTAPGRKSLHVFKSLEFSRYAQRLDLDFVFSFAAAESPELLLNTKSFHLRPRKFLGVIPMHRMKAVLTGGQVSGFKFIKAPYAIQHAASMGTDSKEKDAKFDYTLSCALE